MRIVKLKDGTEFESLRVPLRNLSGETSFFLVETSKADAISDKYIEDETEKFEYTELQIPTDDIESISEEDKIIPDISPTKQYNEWKKHVNQRLKEMGWKK